MTMYFSLLHLFTFASALSLASQAGQILMSRRIKDDQKQVERVYRYRISTPPTTQLLLYFCFGPREVEIRPGPLAGVQGITN